MSDSLRAQASRINSGAIANVLSLVVLAGGLIGAYAELRAQQAASLVVDTGQDHAIERLLTDVSKMRDDKETARELSALRAQIAALQATVEALRDEARRRKR